MKFEFLPIDEEHEEEIDSDSEADITKWQLYRSGGMESAKCAERIEDFLWKTVREVISKGGQPEKEMVGEIIERVADFMCQPENAEWGASDSEPLHVLNYYVPDTIDEYLLNRHRNKEDVKMENDCNGGYLTYSQLLIVSSELTEYIMTTHQKIDANELYETNPNNGELGGLKDEYQDIYCNTLDSVQELIRNSVSITNEESHTD